MGWWDNFFFLMICHTDEYEPKQIFSEMRGQWKAATRSQEIIRSVQRYYRNACMDPAKQDAINVYVNYFLYDKFCQADILKRYVQL